MSQHITLHYVTSEPDGGVHHVISYYITHVFHHTRSCRIVLYWFLVYYITMNHVMYHCGHIICLIMLFCAELHCSYYVSLD